MDVYSRFSHSQLPQVRTLISAASGAAADLKLKDGDQVQFGDYVPRLRWGWDGPILFWCFGPIKKFTSSPVIGPIYWDFKKKFTSSPRNYREATIAACFFKRSWDQAEGFTEWRIDFVWSSFSNQLHFGLSVDPKTNIPLLGEICPPLPVSHPYLLGLFMVCGCWNTRKIRKIDSAEFRT